MASKRDLQPVTTSDVEIVETKEALELLIVEALQYADALRLPLVSISLDQALHRLRAEGLQSQIGNDDNHP